MGYKFQFVTLAGFHSLNHGMFELARGYRDRGMTAYSELQQAEFASEAAGYTATRHQREVGTGYFDAIATAISAGQASTVALDRIDRNRPVRGRRIRRRTMGQRYWVIGGEYRNCRFDEVVPGHRGNLRPVPRRAPGAHRMAAPDLPRPRGATTRYVITQEAARG